jgi:hypothetical protein
MTANAYTNLLACQDGLLAANVAATVDALCTYWLQHAAPSGTAAAPSGTAAEPEPPAPAEPEPQSPQPLSRNRASVRKRKARTNASAWEQTEEQAKHAKQNSTRPAHTKKAQALKQQKCTRKTNISRANTSSCGSPSDPNHSQLPRNKVSDPEKTIQKKIRQATKNLRPSVRDKVVQVLQTIGGVQRRMSKTQKKSQQRQAVAMRLMRHKKNMLKDFQALLEDHNANFSDLQLTMEDMVGLHMMQQDPKMQSYVQGNATASKLKDAWVDDGIAGLISHLRLHPDECLLLKEVMMVSYAGWDEMKRETNMPVKGSYDLKMLAKQYNAYLKDQLGFTPVTQLDEDGNVTFKGYKVGFKQLHRWIVQQAIFHGLDPKDIPAIIIYKLSVDGSNLGSRNAELVALTPMNLPCINPLSYHSIFPLMLYEGKETRKHLKEILTPLNADMDDLEADASLPELTDINIKCKFHCCADFFALVKIMRPEKDEVLEDGKKAESCTCALCGERRSTKQQKDKKGKKAGWDKNITEDVWDKLPNELLTSCILKNMPLGRFIFCVLHMKVRVMGTLLKYVVRECESKGTAQATAKAMKQIVRTFNITLKGEVVKSTGKKNTKAAKVSAMQGGQVDKILGSTRAFSKPEDERSQDEAAEAQKWEDVLTATKIGTDRDTSLLPFYTKIFTQFTQCYDLLNSTEKVTDEQLETYQTLITSFSKDWTSQHGLRSVTPYLHIIFKHSYAYLKQYRTLRPWSQEAFEASHKRHKQLYAKTNFGGGKFGDPSSAFLQVLQKLYRRQYLQRKITLDNSSTRNMRNAFMKAYRKRVTNRRKAGRQRVYYVKKKAPKTKT